MYLETGTNVVDPSSQDWLMDPCSHMEVLSRRYEQFGLVCIRPPPLNGVTARRMARQLAQFRTHHIHKQKVSRYRSGPHIEIVNEPIPGGTDLSLNNCFERFEKDDQPSDPPKRTLHDAEDILKAMTAHRRDDDTWNEGRIKEVEREIWAQLEKGNGALYSSENDGESRI